jgi:hypothetical protein
VIGFVICGVEHSGTTLISELFRQVPGVDAGFEVGVLLSPSPRRFLQEEPYTSAMPRGWTISPDQLAFCCDTDSFDEFYRRLKSVSLVLKESTLRIFDKTPRYLAYLESCLKKVSVPFIITYKDPRAIVYSDFRRSGAADFDAWFDYYAAFKAGYLKQLYDCSRSKGARSRRVLHVSLEHLCLHPKSASEAMFAHCGQEFSLRYLLFNQATSISPGLPFQYLDALSKRQQNMIAERFGQLDHWFYR